MSDLLRPPAGTMLVRRCSRCRLAIHVLALLGFVISEVCWPATAVGQAAWSDLARTVSIGDALDAETGLTRVGSAVTDETRIYVGQPMEKRVRVFSTDGRFLGFIGSQGRGPGEFLHVGFMGLRDSQVWVSDEEVARVQYFDSDFNYVSGVVLRGHSSVPGSRLDVRGVLRDGTLLAAKRLWADEAARMGRNPHYMYRLDSLGVLRDTAAVLGGLAAAIAVREGMRSGPMFMLLPVAEQSLWRAAPDGSGFVVVHREAPTGPTEHTYRVIRVGAAGDTAFVRDFPYDPVPISASWLANEVDRAVSGSEDSPSMGDHGRFRRAVARAFGVLKYFSPVNRLHVGAGGTTWLELRTGERSFEWLVLDPAGREIRRFEPPAGRRLVSGDPEGTWWVEHDALDIPYLVRYEFRDRE